VDAQDFREARCAVAFAAHLSDQRQDVPQLFERACQRGGDDGGGAMEEVRPARGQDGFLGAVHEVNPACPMGVDVDEAGAEVHAAQVDHAPSACGVRRGGARACGRSSARDGGCAVSAAFPDIADPGSLNAEGAGDYPILKDQPGVVEKNGDRGLRRGHYC
jgi:hypothetical protein